LAGVAPPRRCHLVHALVLAAFHGPRPSGHEGAHTNGIGSDNRACNLTWKTHTANEADKRVHGTLAAGERNDNRRFSDDDIRFIRSSTESRRRLAERFSTSRQNIGFIIRRDTWGHIL
jgi:hypothetical protein